ncbi:MAG: hypothetical protein WD431_12600 [Cyclobacteriaceae bacterium]
MKTGNIPIKMGIWLIGEEGKNPYQKLSKNESMKLKVLKIC